MVVLNPAARTGRCRRLARPFLQRLRARGVELEVHETSARFEALLHARTAFEAGARDFLAVGGDGTLFEVLNGALPSALDRGEEIRVGLLPLGTGNSFAQSFELPGRHGGYLQGVEQTLRNLDEGRTTRVDILRVMTTSGDFFAASFFAFGLACSVAELCERRFKRLGAFGYQVATAVEALRAEPQRVDLVLAGGGDTDSWRGEALTVGMHNTPLFGGALPIAPLADPTDGLLDCVVVSDTSRSSLLRALPLLRTGQHLSHPAVHGSRARQVHIQDPTPRAVMMDGEIRELEVHTVEIVPALVRFWI